VHFSLVHLHNSFTPSWNHIGEWECHGFSIQRGIKHGSIGQCSMKMYFNHTRLSGTNTLVPSFHPWGPGCDTCNTTPSLSNTSVSCGSFITKIDCDYFYSDSVTMWRTGKRGATSIFTTVLRENIQSFFVEKDRW
jgi:hypothetical protein